MEIFADPEIRKQYRRFCLEDTNIPLLMFMALVLLTGFGTRFSLQNFWKLNDVMIIAFVVGIFSFMIGAASGAVRMAVWEPIASYPLLTTQVCITTIRNHWIHRLSFLYILQYITGWDTFPAATMSRFSSIHSFFRIRI
jgi:uncharacterized membrane protein (DUF485 family)